MLSLVSLLASVVGVCFLEPIIPVPLFVILIFLCILILLVVLLFAKQSRSGWGNKKFKEYGNPESVLKKTGVGLFFEAVYGPINNYENLGSERNEIDQSLLIN